MQGLLICKLKTENERLTIKKEDIFHKISNTNDSKITLAVFLICIVSISLKNT